MSGRRQGGLERWVPGLRTLREYQRSWLPNDLVAGLVLTALLIPVGPDRFFPTIGTAVDGYLQATGVKWVDWEEQGPPPPPTPRAEEGGQD